MIPSRDAIPLIIIGVGFVVIVGGIVAFFLPGAGSGAYLELEPADTPDTAPVTSEADLRADQHRLIAQAASRSGSDATVAYGYNPIHDVEEFVRLNGTYYRVTANRTNDTARVEKSVVVVAPIANVSDTVPLTDYGHHTAEIIAPNSGSNKSRTVVLQPDMRGSGELLPTPRYENVTWKNQTYSIHVENRTVEQSVYTLSASAVATNESAFTEYLIENEVRAELTADQFTEEERGIIEEAIEDTYDEEEPFSEAYESVLESIWKRDVDAIREMEVLIRYDGELYRAELVGYSWG